MSGAVGAGAFTMRELLGDLKDSGYQEPEDSDSSPGNNLEFEISKSSLHDSQNNVTMELINSVIGVDEESRSRQRILTFAAKRYAIAIERNPEDHDSLYNWALVLQESADNVDAMSPSKDALLEEACKKYDETTRICPDLHDAFYNWAIAISDRAKMRGRTKEAEELWKQATECYERAVELSWNSPQALNNWGLALQELSAIVPAREKQRIVKAAITKFRSAIQLQFDFHRAIYNLGTVLYGLAEDRLRRRVSQDDDAYSQSAIYIAIAHALRPNYSVYHSALKLVRSMLPLPYLKVGYLNAPPVDKAVAPHSDWKRCQFFLNHGGLFQEQEKERRVDVENMASAAACADLTLPPGPALRIDTIQPSSPLFLVADSWETVDQWLDALRLIYTVHARGNRHVLAALLVG